MVDKIHLFPGFGAEDYAYAHFFSLEVSSPSQGH